MTRYPGDPPEPPTCPECGEYVNGDGDCEESDCDGHRMTEEEERDAHGDFLYEQERERRMWDAAD